MYWPCERDSMARGLLVYVGTLLLTPVLPTGRLDKGDDWRHRNEDRSGVEFKKLRGPMKLRVLKPRAKDKLVTAQSPLPFPSLNHEGSWLTCSSSYMPSPPTSSLDCGDIWRTCLPLPRISVPVNPAFRGLFSPRSKRAGRQQPRKARCPETQSPVRAATLRPPTTNNSGELAIFLIALIRVYQYLKDAGFEPILSQEHDNTAVSPRCQALKNEASLFTTLPISTGWDRMGQKTTSLKSEVPTPPYAHCEASHNLGKLTGGNRGLAPRPDRISNERDLHPNQWTETARSSSAKRPCNNGEGTLNSSKHGRSSWNAFKNDSAKNLYPKKNLIVQMSISGEEVQRSLPLITEQLKPEIQTFLHTSAPRTTEELVKRAEEAETDIEA
ncbi:hypothetical protein PR048_001540 [Dryococelus australis]|uniref:Uncharacterized protein n=1 Tax=Dryococelus australis TaxID=614101 RepID=A0ABQ9IIC7_9NEOP|nr:hypothetical protein PR048_001540 [Dryococelus australis]